MITQIENGNTKDVKIMVPLKYSSNFWGTLEIPLIPLINCENSLILTWSANFFVTYAYVENQVPTFTINDTKLNVPVITLAAHDNAKLLQQLKLGFKRTINWNKCQSKVTILEQNRYLEYLIERSFQGENRLFVLIFESNTDRASYKK